MSAAAPATSRPLHILTELAHGLGSGYGAVSLLSDGRRYAAGREPIEGALAIGALQQAWHIANRQSTAAFGRQLLPTPPGLMGSLGLECLGLASILLLNRLEARGAYRTAFVVRLVARTILAASLATLVAAILSAAVAGQWIFLAGAVGAGLLGVAAERGWIPARFHTHVQMALFALGLLRALIAGSYLLVIVLIAAGIYTFKQKSDAQNATALPPGQFIGMQNPIVRERIENHLRASLLAADPNSAEGARFVRPRHALTVHQPTTRLNYHGLTLQAGVRVEPHTWASFEWPDWLSQETGPEWEHQMRAGLQRHNPDLNLRGQSAAQLWEQMNLKLRNGFAAIAAHRSNGGMIADWRPIEAAVQELLDKTSRARTPDAQARIRRALCECVGRLQSCGAGIDIALQEVVRGELQGGSSTASFVLYLAAQYRAGLVEEAFRERCGIFLTVQHGQTGVHAMAQAAYVLPELNLPSLPVALRDPNVGVSLGMGTLLQHAIDWDRMWSVSDLSQAVGMQLSAEPGRILEWVNERVPVGALKDEILGALAWLPIAEEAECPHQRRMQFFQELATAMLLDVGLFKLQPRI